MNCGTKRRLACGFALGLAACGTDGGGRDGASGGGLATLGSASDGSSGGLDTEGDSAADPSGGASTDPTGGGPDGDSGSPAFDVGGSGTGDAGEPPEAGCQAVDFLFVIDNSVSMDPRQAALIEAFPGFMSAIESTLEEGTDFHVLVADTDAWGRCNTANPWQGVSPGHATCNGYIEQQVFHECDRALGAGVVHPAGRDSTNATCTPAGGNRYIVADEPNLTDTFACMATVGTAGHPSERPMDAMVAALAPGINGPGGCNAGFLRDDALLVVTFISDDPNYEDEGTPQDWYNAVVAAKNADPTSVVVLGLTPAWPGCKSGSPKGAHWAEFIELWGEQGLHGNVCSSAEEYVSFFEAAVSTIDQACNDFTPPG
jgi:hypothetical protein